MFLILVRRRDITKFNQFLGRIAYLWWITAIVLKEGGFKITSTNLPDKNKDKTASTRLCDGSKQTLHCHRYFYRQYITRRGAHSSCLLLIAAVHPEEKHQEIFYLILFLSKRFFPVNDLNNDILCCEKVA